MRPCGAAALHLTSANRRWHLQDPPRDCGHCDQDSWDQHSFVQHSLLENDAGGVDAGFAARLIDYEKIY